MIDNLITEAIREIINKNNIKKAALVYLTKDREIGWCCSYLEEEVRKAVFELENKMREFEVKDD